MKWGSSLVSSTIRLLKIIVCTFVLKLIIACGCIAIISIMVVVDSAGNILVMLFIKCILESKKCSSIVLMSILIGEPIENIFLMSLW